MNAILHSQGIPAACGGRSCLSLVVSCLGLMQVSRVPFLQGDPTFLYGGYGYRPPSFGYAWTGAQTTSFAQLPTDTGHSSAKALSPKALSK